MALPHNRSWFHLGKIKITRHKFKLWPPSILVSTYPSKTKDQLSISHQRSQWAKSDDEQHCYSSAGLKTYWIKQAGFIQERDSLLLPYPQEHPACLQLTPLCFFWTWTKISCAPVSTRGWSPKGNGGSPCIWVMVATGRAGWSSHSVSPC